jgi:hypothetical protein
VGHFYWANTKLEAVECVPLPLSSVWLDIRFWPCWEFGSM